VLVVYLACLVVGKAALNVYTSSWSGHGDCGDEEGRHSGWIGDLYIRWRGQGLYWLDPSEGDFNFAAGLAGVGSLQVGFGPSG